MQPPQISVSSATHDTSAVGGRERFGVEELAIVMSHYDIGPIKEIREFPRGSRKSPKLLIDAESGQFLLKRRARGRDDLTKVAFSHLVQLHLASQQFPLPHLVGTRGQNNSMLHRGGQIYELFEYIPGQGYPQTLDATLDSGRVLGLYHKLLASFTSEYQPPVGSFHNAPSVEQGLKLIPKKLPNDETTAACLALLELYRTASARSDAAGLAAWPMQIVHADWHPGNMLFRDGRIVAVIDYDSSRQMQKIIDVSNGALQFSISGGDDDVRKWPAELDEERFKQFIKGYDQVQLLSQAELEVMPYLMIEALIAEAVFPIAATGTFSRFDGLAFLEMVRRKTTWLRDHARRLAAIVTA